LVESIEEIEENNAEEPNKYKNIVNTDSNALRPLLYAPHQNHGVQNYYIYEQNPS
jgi:hypothetical protein